MMDKEKNSKNEKVEDKLNSFIGKNKKLFLGIGIALVAVIIVLCVALAMVQKSTNARFDALAALEGQHGDLVAMGPSADGYADAEAAFTAAAEELTAAGLDKYPGAKAMYLLADIAYSEGDYQSAADMYAQIASAQSGTYLGPLCLMNEAACYENLGDSDTALGLYRQVVDTYGDHSAQAPKAMFSIGRIYDAQGQTDLAQAEFETLTGLYLVPSNGAMPSEYARMAQAYLINYAD